MSNILREPDLRTIRFYILLVSLISLGITALGVVYLIWQVFFVLPKDNDATRIMASVGVILILLSITYIVGSTGAIIGARIRRGLVFPIIFELLSWLLTTFLLLFYMYALTRLWLEDYSEITLIRIAAILVIGFFTLFAFQLATYNRNMVRFGILLLFMNLTHLYALVFRYEFLVDFVNSELFRFDIGFFAGMVFITAFLFLGGGLLRRIQGVIDLILQELPINQE